LNRWPAFSAILGGLTYLLLHLAIETAFPDHWSGSPDRLLGMSYAGWSRLLWIPSALLLSGLIGIYRHVAHALGRLGKWGFRLAAAGCRGGVVHPPFVFRKPGCRPRRSVWTELDGGRVFSEVTVTYQETA
jgi:hypothetical protein